MEKVPLSKPYLDEEDIQGVVDVLKSGQLCLGPKIEEFEKRLAAFVQRKYGIAVNSGTSALHLCVEAINLKEGDEVITTPISFIASANCILYKKAKPVFADVEEDTWNINPENINKKISKKTKALIPVHLFCQPCNMDPIMKTAEENSLAVIEDSCEVIGAEYKKRKAGSFGTASVFSFYPNKQMTTGEGGMVVTDNEAIAKLCDSLRNQGRAEMLRGGDDWLSHDKIGYNFRLDDIAGSLGLTQLKKIDSLVDKRNKAAFYYRKLLEKVDGVEVQKISPNTTKTSWFVFVAKADENINRDALMNKLIEKGIPTRPYFPALHLQPLYQKMFGYKEGDCPTAEAISKQTFSLPFFTEITKEQIEMVCKELQEAVNEVSK